MSCTQGLFITDSKLININSYYLRFANIESDFCVENEQMSFTFIIVLHVLHVKEKIFRAFFIVVSKFKFFSITARLQQICGVLLYSISTSRTEIYIDWNRLWLIRTETASAPLPNWTTDAFMDVINRPFVLISTDSSGVIVESTPAAIVPFGFFPPPPLNILGSC